MTDSVAIEPCALVTGEMNVPGDKSITHRALLIGAIGEGEMLIEGASPAQDCLSTLRSIRDLGVDVQAENPSPRDPDVQVDLKGLAHGPLGSQIVVRGRGWEGLSSPSKAIDVGNSGTTIRLLTGILAGSSVSAVVTGDSSIRRRPMGRIVTPLRRMGADITGPHGGDRAPLRIHGVPLHGEDHDLPVASAQIKSALLLAGLHASGQSSVGEPHLSRDHTERLLGYLGIHIDISVNRLVVTSTNITNGPVSVPGDLSSAAFLLVAAAIRPGSSIAVHDVGLNPTRTGILDVLRAFGADVAVSNFREACGEPVGSVTVHAADRRPVSLGGELTVRAIDELPLVALLGALAHEGVTEVRDAAELRVKESDRIAATVDMLQRMGVRIQDLPDGFIVYGGSKLRSARINPRGDHRIAMTAAVAGLFAEDPVVVEGWSCVGVSYPGFEQALVKVAVR